MINSAEEFVELVASDDRGLRRRAAHDTATNEVWSDIIERYPEMRQWVARNDTSPLHILRALARDPDRKVRFHVARAPQAESDVLEMLASDAESSVRARVAWNKTTPKETLLRLVDDPSEDVAQVAKKRLSQEEDMKKRLYTGVRLLARPDVAERNFGMVEGSGALTEPGRVHISLDTRHVEVRAKGPFISVTLPEEWASGFVKHTAETIVRLQHLRGLYKLELLASNALHDVPPLGLPLWPTEQLPTGDVNTRDDLARFVRELASELRAGEREWENTDLQSFLDALAVLLANVDKYYEDRGQAPPEQPSWRAFAEMLVAAATYG
jgi:hypothetical protein